MENREELRARANATRKLTKCTHLDARRFGARRSVLRRSVHAPRRSTLGARTSTLRRSVHAPRRSTLRRLTLHASTPRRSVHAPRRSTPRRSTPQRLVHASRRSVLTPRRSTLRCIDARCTHLDARRFGARLYTRRRLDARRFAAYSWPALPRP
ncbi:UNVERIFIED_CONTAM: hypothetical protein FKN15_055534 [Acipenser sinensis]